MPVSSGSAEAGHLPQTDGKVRKRARGAGRPNVVSADTVLAAAGELLDAKGWFAFSVRQLAKQLGVAPGTIYRRFGNKDELVARVYVARIDEACTFVEGLEPEATRSMAQLLATIAP